MPESKSFRGSFSGYERDHLFLNLGNDGLFYDAAYAFAIDFSDDGRSFAPVDVDGDGDLDIPLLSLQNLRLIENTTPNTKNFTRIRLKATKTQHHALDAEVLVTHNKITQRDYVKVNAGFQTQVPLDLHFGLGTDRSEQSSTTVEVRWPSGKTEKFDNVPANQLILITEGAGIAPKKLPTWTKIRRAPSEALDIRFEAKTLSGQLRSLAQTGKPAVINFWAPWCKPCAREIPEFKKFAQKTKGKVQTIGISVETKDLDSVRQFIKTNGINYSNFLSSTALLESFFGGDGEAPLPSTFVFDASGSIKRVFNREVTSKELEQIISSFDTDVDRSHFLLRKAEAAMGRGDLREAENILRAAIKESPKNAFLQAQLGTVLTMKQPSKEGTDYLRAATVLDPTLPEAWYRLGTDQKNRGQFLQASRSYQKAVELRPSDLRLVLGYAAMLSKTGKNEEAVIAFETATKIDPKSVEAWLNLGKTRAILKRLDCIEAFEKVLALDPGNKEAQQLLSMVRQLR